MTHQQRQFVDHYLISFSSKAAALAAGYKESRAGVTGSELLRNPEIRAAIQEATEVKLKEEGIDPAYVLRHLQEIVRRCETRGNDFDPANAIKALDLLGRSLKMFVDRVEVSDTKDLAERLKRAFAEELPAPVTPLESKPN